MSATRYPRRALELEPTFMFLRLIPNPGAFNAIVADRDLALDAFVERHRHTLQTVYAQERNDMTLECASQAAAELWRYLRFLLSWTDDLVATSPVSDGAGLTATVPRPATGISCRPPMAVAGKHGAMALTSHQARTS